MAKHRLIFLWGYTQSALYTHNQLLLKSSYTERKQVSWFLIRFEMFSESFVIKYKVKMYDSYIFFCLKSEGKFCNSYTAEFHMLEIARQILYWYTRDSFAWIFESCILPFLITKLNFWEKNCYTNFWQYVTIFTGYR